jgi:hypothetical protein
MPGPQPCTEVTATIQKKKTSARTSTQQLFNHRLEPLHPCCWSLWPRIVSKYLKNPPISPLKTSPCLNLESIQIHSQLILWHMYFLCDTVLLPNIIIVLGRGLSSLRLLLRMIFSCLLLMDTYVSSTSCYKVYFEQVYLPRYIFLTPFFSPDLILWKNKMTCPLI